MISNLDSVSNVLFLLLRLGGYVTLILLIVMVYKGVDTVAGNGGRRPLQLVLLALFLSNIDLPVVSICQTILTHITSQNHPTLLWIFFVNRLFVIVVMLFLVRSLTIIKKSKDIDE